MSQALRVAQVTTGRFHQFDLARQLERRGLLSAMVTGYPRWKLRGEGLPAEKLKPFPWVHAPYMALAGRLPWQGVQAAWLHASHRLIDAWAARVLRPTPDVLIAMSGHGMAAGRRTQANGGAWVCVRGSTHVRTQARILQAEHARLGLKWTPPLEASMRREEAEYAACDRIAVPSRVVWESFVAEGVAAEKLALIPYGADLTRFYPDGAPPHDGVFRISSVGAPGVRKGTPRLVEAFARLKHPRKELILIGAITPDWRRLALGLPMAGVTMTGTLPQTEVRSWLGRSHVFALCSVEEGLANVLGQALACGCPVVASAATGAENLFTDGVEGYILPEAEPAAVHERLAWLAAHETRRAEMGRAARARVECLGGWDRYGDLIEALVRTLAEKEAPMTPPAETDERLVSVLIVAHNAGSYLREAVNSVRAQTYPWHEIVLVDNGSTDGAVEAVHREWGSQPGLTVVRSKQNLGPAGGACLGLPACRGFYVARLDADDLARTDRLALQVAFLNEHPSLAAVGADAVCIDAAGKPVKPRLALRTAFLRKHGGLWESACPHSSLMVRRREADLRFYNPTLWSAEDFEWIEWLASSGRLGLIAQPLIYYRLHESSLTATRVALNNVSGMKMRLNISETIGNRAARARLGTDDFSGLATDEFIETRDRPVAFLAEAKARENWLGAAYFATISNLWREFPWLLWRALWTQPGAKATLALLVMRTGWPVWKRVHRFFWAARRSIRRPPDGSGPA